MPGARSLGSLFPTSRRIDRIDGIDVTCIDAAMPLMIARAADLGVAGRESPTCSTPTPNCCSASSRCAAPPVA
jgi:2-methylaconitate cis-trans-isomerase PrpF